MNIQCEIPKVEFKAEARSRGWWFAADLLPGIVLMLDMLAILASGAVCFAVLVETSGYVFDYYAFATVFIALTMAPLLGWGGLYDAVSMRRPTRWLDVMFAAIATSLLLLLTVVHALKLSGLFQTDWLVSFAIAAFFALAAVRLGVSASLDALLERGLIGRRVAVLGAGIQGRRFLNKIAAAPGRLSTVCGVFDPAPPLIGADVAGHAVVGDFDDLMRALRRHAFDEVVVALPADDMLGQAELRLPNVIEKLRELPVDVYLAPDVTEFGVPLRPVLQNASGVPMFEVWQRPISGWSRVLKIAEDYLLAAIALVLLAPALVIIAVAIKLDSPGPILFRQRRLGFNNQVFEIFKFRTMYHREVPEHRVMQASRGDPRVTSVGRILRKTSLDELPQLLNVLNGTMSLVGPRPHALSHNEDFSQVVRGYFGRHKVKPGITGWAQVNGLRGEIDTQSKLEARVAHDVHYAENWSLFFDIRIMIVTVMVVLFQKSAY